jgi:hypothetical protein
MFLPQFTGKLSHKVVKNICSCHNSLANYRIKLHKYASPEVGIKRTTLALIGTEYRGWCKFSYHGILTSPVPACMVRNNMWAYLEITWIKASYMEQFLIMDSCSVSRNSSIQSFLIWSSFRSWILIMWAEIAQFKVPYMEQF